MLITQLASLGPNRIRCQPDRQRFASILALLLISHLLCGCIPVPAALGQQHEPTVAPIASTATPASTAIPTSFRQQIFERVWTKVDEEYLYTDFRGVDWQRVHDRYAPDIRRAQSSTEFYQLLGEMVRELNDGHSRFIAPSEARLEDNENTGDHSGVGIGVLSMNLADSALVQQVFANSPAQRAGLQVRDRIVAVNGVPFADASTEIDGPANSTVQLTIERPGHGRFEVLLTRRFVHGRVEPQAHRIAGDIGYLTIPTLWVSDMGSQVAGALSNLVAEGELRGLIIDLRGNRGGWREVLTSTMGHFVRGKVGAFFSQHEVKPLVINAAPGPDLTKIPIVVLIDQRSASYAEVLAGILQERGRARVVGQSSAGNTETTYGYDFEDGSRLWIAQEGFRLQNGVNLEGRGVQPDVFIGEDWTHFSENDDPYIQAALCLFDPATDQPDK